MGGRPALVSLIVAENGDRLSHARAAGSAFRLSQ